MNEAALHAQIHKAGLKSYNMIMAKHESSQASCHMYLGEIYAVFKNYFTHTRTLIKMPFTRNAKSYRNCPSILRNLVRKLYSTVTCRNKEKRDL
jgi:hypothetical protein